MQHHNINTSYVMDDGINEYPIDPQIITLLSQRQLTDTKQVSFAQVTNGPVDFEDWAYHYHIPGLHGAKRVQARYLMLYEQLLKEKTATKQPDSASHVAPSQPKNKPTITKIQRKQQPAASNKPDPLQIKMINTPISNQLKTDLARHQLTQQNQLVKYDQVSLGANMFENWANSVKVPFDRKTEQTLAKYARFYEICYQVSLQKRKEAQLDRELKQARKEEQIEKQKRAQQQASLAAKQQVQQQAKLSANASTKASNQNAKQKSSVDSQFDTDAKNQTAAKKITDSLAVSKNAFKKLRKRRDDGTNPFNNKGHVHADTDANRLFGNQNTEIDSDVASVLGPASFQNDDEGESESTSESTKPIDNDNDSFLNDDGDSDLFGDGEDDPGMDDYQLQIEQMKQLNDSLPADEKVDESDVDEPAGDDYMPQPIPKDRMQLAQQLVQEDLQMNQNGGVMDVTQKDDRRAHYVDDSSFFVDLPNNVHKQYGPYKIARKLKKYDDVRLKFDNNQVKQLRQVFATKFLKDKFAIDAVNRYTKRNDRNDGIAYLISDTDIVQSYMMYSQVAMGIYGLKTWRQYCAAKVYDTVVLHRKNGEDEVKPASAKKLRSQTNITKAIYNDNQDDPNCLSLETRWYLYLSQQTPVMPDADFNENSTRNQLKRLSESNQILQYYVSTMVALLSISQNQDMRNVLFDDRIKRMVNFMHDHQGEVLKTQKTRDRTSQYQARQPKSNHNFDWGGHNDQDGDE